VILIDSNVLTDVFDRDPNWFIWSSAQIRQATAHAVLVTTPVVVGELAPRFETLEELIATLSALLIGIEPMTAAAAFAAGKAFQHYRDRRKAASVKSILADFLVGGHAAVLNASILTRDPRFYRSYFPEIPLITPESHP